MARKVQRFAIDGTQYEFMQLGAVEGIELFHDLRKLAIPVLREVIQGGLLDGKVDLEKLDAESTAKIASVVFGLFESLPKALERDLRAAFARSCKFSSAGAASALLEMGDAFEPNGIFDQHFAGEYGRYQKWLLAGLKFNFAGFLGGSGSSKAPERAPTP
jgi:hypothetical protein